MRAVLPHQIGQKRRSRHARSERSARAVARETVARAKETVTKETVARETVARETGAAVSSAFACAGTPGPAADADACRVRAAGGPLDRASYTCGCGCVFAAAVTTTVACPHCGDAQAW
jgi:hypothetical protein